MIQKEEKKALAQQAKAVKNNMLETDKRIVLASQSPRRKELLSLIFNNFEVIPSDAEENVNYELPPHEIVQELAENKARYVCEGLNDSNAVVIGADTIVYCDGRVMLKPRDRRDAENMLSTLSGREHSVFTGVSIVTLDSTETFYSETRVKFKELSKKDIESYIDTNEPMDKAGAYGIQGYGALFVERIDGNYHNVVGLPTSEIYCRFRSMTNDE